jgi:putative ABC transport system permease protein
LGTWLVAGEIALAVVLAVASALTLQTLWRLQRAPLGYVTENVGIINLRVAPEKYADDNALVGFQDAVLRRAASLPGVVSAALVSDLNEYGSGRRRSFTIAGQTPQVVAERPTVGVFCGSPDYGAVLGIPLVKGRGFVPSDRMGAPRVAIVNQRFVDRFFAGENPLGRRVTIDLPPTGRAQSDAAAAWEIVGVMANVKSGGGRGGENTSVMLPFAQQPSVDPVLVVRTSLRPEAVLRTLRASLLEYDRDLVVFRMTTMEALLGGSMKEDRDRARLLGGFATLAVFLAGLGVYGVVSYQVSQRTRDIGIRLALGAQPAEVRTMILREGAVMAAFGGGIGLLLSLAAGRLLESMLFGVSAIDPWSLLAATVLMSAVTLLGCWIPARRATRVSPTEALRAE